MDRIISFKISKSASDYSAKDEHYEGAVKRLKTTTTTKEEETTLPLPPHLTREALQLTAKAKSSRRVSTRLQKLNSRVNDPFTVLPDNVVEVIIRSLDPQDNARIRGVCKLWKAQVEYCISPGYVTRLFSSRRSFDGVDKEDPRWAEKFYRKQSCCEELQRSGKATKVWKFTRSVAWALCGERMVWIDGTDICVQHLQPWNEAERVRTLQAVAKDPNAVQKNKSLNLLLQDLNRGPSSRRLRPAYKNAHNYEPITVRFGLNDVLKTRKAKIFINNVLGSKDGFLIVDYMQRHLNSNEDQGGYASNLMPPYDYISQTQFQNKLACIDIISGHAKWMTNIDGQVQRRLAFMSPGLYWSRTRYSTGYFLIAGDKFVSFTMYTVNPKNNNNNNNNNGGSNATGTNNDTTNNNNNGNNGTGSLNITGITNHILNLNHQFQFAHSLLGGNHSYLQHKRISLTVREISTGKVVAEETCEEQYPMGNGYFERPTNFFADPAGTKVGAVLSKELFIYSVETAKCIKRVPLTTFTDEHTYQFDVMFSGDGTKLHITEERLGSDFSSYTLDCNNDYKVIREDRYRTPSRINRSLKTVFSPRSQTAVFFRRNETRGEWHPEMAKFKPISEIIGSGVAENTWADEWKKRHLGNQTFAVDGPQDGWRVSGSGQVPDFIPSIFGQPTIHNHPNIHVVHHHNLTVAAAAAQVSLLPGNLTYGGHHHPLLGNTTGILPLQAAKEQALREVPRTEYACVTRRPVTLPPSKEPSGSNSTTTTSSRKRNYSGRSVGRSMFSGHHHHGSHHHQRQPMDTKLPNGRREFWITWRWGPQSIKFSDQYLVFDQEDTIFVCDFGPIGW